MDKRLVKIVIVASLIRLTLSLAFLSDPALADVHSLDIVPYGILWQVTNPLYWRSYYPQVMVLVEVPVTIINYKLLSSRWFYAWLIVDFHWFTGFFANASVTWLYPYPVIGFVWAVLEKLPIGYWPILNNPHVNCALWCSGISGEIAKGYVWRWGNIITYGIISLTSVIPTLLWSRKRWLDKRQRTRRPSSGL